MLCDFLKTLKKISFTGRRVFLCGSLGVVESDVEGVFFMASLAVLDVVKERW